MSEKILNVDYESEMGQSYVDYSMSVITERALPDVRDGLKPVQRRILYSLDGLAGSDKPHRKCARIVGDTMGKYHPHGDSSIYEGLVNMAQNWKLPIPLVDPHGNFGAVDGSGAAAMRYTEARISKYTEDVCMKDLPFFKDQFIPNFDGTETEPTFLPFQVPNILVSGSTGIAVGMATNIPTHNLGEVIDATVAYLNDPEIQLEDLLALMPGPDFATGGIINVTPEELYNVYATGLGKIKVRGKVEVRDIGYGRKSICVTELPYTMIGGTAKFLDTVAELVRNRELPAVVDIADRGDKNGECLCIDVKKGTSDEEIQNIINILYKKAALEDTFGVNINCINNGKPEVMGLKKILKVYTDFKYGLYDTKYRKLLAQQEEIREIKMGLLTAVDCIDLIIEILRGSTKVADAKACLMHGDTSNIKFRFKGSEADAKFLCFTEKQADAILAMRLQKLIGLEINALKKELADAEKLIKKYTRLMESRDAMKQQMIDDMLEIKAKYADVIDQLPAMKELYGHRARLRKERGCMDIESGEVKLILDENGRCIDVKKRTSGESESMIEEFMLLANQCAAHFARVKQIPFVYRVHEEPNAEKLERLHALLQACGINDHFAKDVPTPKELSAILEGVRGTPYEQIINTGMLRCMSKALYEEKPKGHYGLVLKDYAHFTSPIRRYPDLAIHRIMTDLLSGTDKETMAIRYTDFAAQAAKQSSEREVIAVQIERKAEDCYKAEYARRHLGECYEGIISGVTQRGLFVELENGVEGFVPASSLTATGTTLTEGIRLSDPVSGKNWNLGDSMMITIVRADVNLGKVDFEVAPENKQ